MRYAQSLVPRRFNLVMASSILAVTISTAAYAASDSFCESYANKAANQHHENIRLGCGFEGLRWNDNKPGAFIFCKAAGKGSSKKETNQRNNMLEQCRATLQAQEPGDGDQGQDFDDEQAQDDAIGEQEVIGSDGHDCKRSDVVEGKGATRQNATIVAVDKLGRLRAKWKNEGLTSCQYNELGCTGENRDRTCWISLDCCPR